MNNEKNKSAQDAEFLDEDDFGLDDADLESGDFDDFDDAEWEEEFGDDSDGASQQAAESGTVAAGAKRKSFISRNFNLILIAIVLLGGGGFFLMKMSKPPVEGTPTDTARDLTGAQSDNLPAMPEGQDLSMDAPSLGVPENIEAEFPDPVPMGQEIAATIEEAPPMPAPINSIPEDVNFVKPDQPPTKPAVKVEEVQQEALAPAPVAANTIEMPAPAAALPTVPVTSAATPVVVADEATKALVQEQAEKIQTLENKISSLEKRLAGKIEGTDKKIENVATTLAALDAKLSTLTTPPPVATKKVAVPVQPVEETPVPPPVAIKAAPKALIPDEAPKQAPRSAPQAPAAASPRWELRFAQPGKAMLAEKGSSDFRTVEIGDTLPGLGKITIIGQEQGRWVVRGTRGSVSQ